MQDRVGRVLGGGGSGAFVAIWCTVAAEAFARFIDARLVGSWPGRMGIVAVVR